MSKLRLSKMYRFVLLFCLICLVSACAGEDYTPLFFKPKDDGGSTIPAPSTSAGTRQCTVSFTSQICVAIKGDNYETGTTKENAMCAEVPPFPIHIEGTKAMIKGDEFPDVNTVITGLDVPVIFNAKGTGDGTTNIGEGVIDAGGNMTIENFSLFIVALGIPAEIPRLTLTTGSTQELPDLPVITGSPPDASGAMILVTGTVLGHTLDAADKYIMGASLTATFTGSISPTLASCAGEDKSSFEIKKLFITANGEQSEAPVPEGNKMEISSGTYIAELASDIGNNFEAKALFRIKNIGSKPQAIRLPSRAGPFFLSSIDPLSQTLTPQQSFMLAVVFRPKNDPVNNATIKPGEIIENITVGQERVTLIAKALSKSGSAYISTVNDENGNEEQSNLGKKEVDVGEARFSANQERSFFICNKIKCHDTDAYTNCGVCNDPATEPCDLLPVTTTATPYGEVNEKCELKEPNATPLLTIDLKGSTSAMIAGHKQVLAVRNKGTADIKITGIELRDAPKSKSTGQFTLPDRAIFIADKFEDIQKEVSKVLSGKEANGIALPVTLSPFIPKYSTKSIYLVVTYTPTDLVGADGRQAGVGSKVEDRAIVIIKTDTGELKTTITGETTIEESPSLEVYVKTSIGTRHVEDADSFSLKGVTPFTLDLAIPLFIRVGDTAKRTQRITSITLEGTDVDHFKFLDTAEKIVSVTPASGKGMRCSIPIIDEDSGSMTGEIFDLKPVSLSPPGYDIRPGEFSVSNMPLFGCVDFYRGEFDPPKKRIFEADIVISAEEVEANGAPSKNPDGSYRETKTRVKLLAAINPIMGKMVLRITQTMAGIFNPKFPVLSSIPSKHESEEDIANGRMKPSDLQVFTNAIILDPYDEMKITSSDGKKIVSVADDGTTAIFRSLDTHPVSTNYDDNNMFDFANLLYDSARPAGTRGIYEDYPNAEDAKANGWRIFTSALSYPGPVAPVEKRPVYLDDCLVVDPCSPEGQRKFTEAGVGPDGKGACAFFYASGGRVDSPSFHTKSELPDGDYSKLCSAIDKPQKLLDIDTGHYSVDGKLVFEEVGLRFFGPTYFHNPGGILGPVPPLDEIFYTGFTTGMIKPQKSPKDYNVLPDPRINLAKGEYKINLDDKSSDLPPLCPTNTKNRVIRGKTYSSWRYLEGLLYKDEAGTIPAGCPNDGDDKYTGGQAYIRGRDVDQETGVITLVADTKFGSSKDLSFAFQDVMMLIVMNGWICNPAGDEARFEGKRCFDATFNDRDADGQLSIMK